MRRESFDIEHAQSMPSENALHDTEGEIREVLVVNGVELTAGDKFFQGRELKRDNPFRLQDDRKASDKIVDIRNVSQDVVGHDEIGDKAARIQVTRRGNPEEGRFGWDAGFSRDGCHVFRGLDTKRRDCASHEGLEQRTIVARDFKYARAPV